MPLPPGTAAKSVQLSVTKSSLTLGLKGREGPVLKVRASNIERREGGRERTIFVCVVYAFFVSLELFFVFCFPISFHIRFR